MITSLQALDELATYTMSSRAARRHETFSVSLFPQEIELLDKIALTYGMGRSQAIRFIVNDWQRMKKDQESS